LRHAGPDDASPSSKPKLAQIPMQGSQGARIAFHEISSHRATGESLDAKGSGSSEQVQDRVRRRRTQDIEDRFAHLRPGGPCRGSTGRA
jgi:hypothetical protein